MEKQKHKIILCAEMDNHLYEILPFSSIEKLDQYTISFKNEEDLFDYISTKEALSEDAKKNIRKILDSLHFMKFKIKYFMHEELRNLDVLYKDDINLFKKQYALFEKLRFSQYYVSDVLLDKYNLMVLFDKKKSLGDINEIKEYLNPNDKEKFKHSHIQSRVRSIFEELMRNNSYPVARHIHVETKKFLKKIGRVDLYDEVSQSFNSIITTEERKRPSFDTTTIMPIEEIKEAARQKGH